MRECIAEYGPLVWAIARRFSTTDGEIEQAVLAIFDQLWEQAPHFDPADASEPTFVATVARGWLLDRLRHTQPRPALVPVPETAVSHLETPIERCAEAALAAGTLATLDPRKRRALSLAIGQGMTHPEIADATGVPVREVKAVVRKALVAVRKRLLAQMSELA